MAISPRTIFQNDWWLEAAAPGAWDRVEISQGGVAVGSLPFYVSRHWGFRYIGMPAYTRVLGPSFNLPDRNPANALSAEVSVLSQLLDALPAHDRFETCLSPGGCSPLPFVCLDYTVTHQFTFRAEPKPIEAVMAGLNQKTRNLIKTSTGRFNVTQDVDIDRFLRMAARQRGVGSLHDEVTLHRLWSAIVAHGQGCILVAEDDAHRDVAACALIWDDHALYFWLSARDTAGAGAGGNSLLMMAAIKMAFERGLALDMDGFASGASAIFLAKFGLTPVVRPFVNGGRPLWRAIKGLSGLSLAQRVDRHYRC